MQKCPVLCGNKSQRLNNFKLKSIKSVEEYSQNGTGQKCYIVTPFDRPVIGLNSERG